MTDNELRVKVAELCGWKDIEERLLPCCRGVKSRLCGRMEHEHAFHACPNFPHDLNACHEMEEALDTFGAKIRYLSYLRLACTGEAKHYPNSALHELLVIRATARQRCEAFVRAMEEVK